MKAKEERQSKQIRSLYREFAEEFFGLPLDNIIDKKRSEGLVRFYIDKIHNLRSSEIDEDDINRGIVDASNDLGVDFIYRDNNQVWIIQSKYHGKQSGGGERLKKTYNTFRVALSASWTRILNRINLSAKFPI